MPPFERAKRNAEKQKFFARLGTPIIRLIVLKGASHPYYKKIRDDRSRLILEHLHQSF